MKFLRNMFFVSTVFCSGLSGIPTNPPMWPSSVMVFAPTDSAATINGAVNAAYAMNGGQSPPNHGQFSNQRYAFLFKPGIYPGVSVPVGYYTSIIGLGQAPSDTQIPDVYCEQGSTDHTTGALDTFWRSAENFSTTPTRLGGVMQWAVSQACPLRRIQLPAPNLPATNALYGIQLWEDQDGSEGFSSGGFMGDCNIASSSSSLFNVNSGSQQQWMSRNCQMNWSGGVWNMVFVGCTGVIPPTTQQSGYLSSSAYTNVATTPQIAEKPYITFNGVLYQLQLPNPETDKTGPTTDFSSDGSPGTATIDFTQVYVVQDPSTETGVNLTNQIKAGYHIILTPGIYSNLGGPIKVTQSICILGIGFPTLIAANGQSCIQVADGLRGVRIAGILLEAGQTTTPGLPLLQWGQSHAAGDFGYLSDCFARVGGTTDPTITPPVTAATMLEINNDLVVCDNVWLWRADHWGTPAGDGGTIKNKQNSCDTGLRVNGDNVIAYGLAVEHTLKDMVQWYGTNGQTYFFQAEYPYDVTQDDEKPGYVAYRASSPTSDPNFSHAGYGMGVYCFFRDFPVTVASGFATSTPIPINVEFTNVLTKFLNGNGGIANVINATGAPVYYVPSGADPSNKVSCVALYPGPNPFYPKIFQRRHR